jgi:glycolate oxidase iron-sulfur subunit
MTARLPEATRRLAEACIHCGYCLPACPTYRVSDHEPFSPRGRIQLLLAADGGRLSFASVMTGSLDSCLGCRACEEACPVGVRYGAILDAARSLKVRRPSAFERAVRFGLRLLIPNRPLLRLALRLAPWLRPILPEAARRNLAGLPKPAPKASPGSAGAPVAPGPGAPKAYLFRGCIQEVAFGATNEATRALLERAGYEVREVPDWRCCGALHRHFGDAAFAGALARRNVAAFPGDGIVVSNAGGCGAALREYAEWLRGTELETAAQGFSLAVRDVSEALVGAPRPLVFAGDGRAVRVAYQPSCHLRFVQKVRQEPLDLLAQSGAEVVDLGTGLNCCGSAGIFSLLQPAMSARVLAVKEGELAAAAADVCVTTNPGCAIQMAQAAGGRIPVRQLPEFLLERLGAPGAPPARRTPTPAEEGIGAAGTGRGR